MAAWSVAQRVGGVFTELRAVLAELRLRARQHLAAARRLADAAPAGIMPALLPVNECEAALRALAEDLEGLDRGLRLEDSLKQIAATQASMPVQAGGSAGSRKRASRRSSPFGA